MIIPIELRFKADKDTRMAVSTNKTIKSHDVNSVEFHIAIEGLELTNNHIAKILSIFHSSKSQVNTDCEIVDGKIIYKPDTKLISMYETVTNYVYVYHNDQSLDVCEFNYTVKLSKIDETALEVKEMYDQSYADLLADFEQALSDYKDRLPQADSVRAEIDVILNQFSVDSQAKLSQFDTDAQQVIADNQTAFDLAESGRQNTYEQAEDIRNQTTNQAVVNWKQGADALLVTVEGNESARVTAESSRETSEADRVSSEATRKTNETIRVSNENERESAEDIRIANEVDRVNAESVRSEFYEGFDGEITTLKTEVAKKANKKQEDWITPTLLNGWADYPGTPVQYRKDEFGVVRFRGRLNPATKTDMLFMTMPAGYRPNKDTYLNYGGDTFLVFLNHGACQSYFSKWHSLEGVSYSTI